MYHTFLVKGNLPLVIFSISPFKSSLFADTKHRSPAKVVLIASGNIGLRQFESWNMLFQLDVDREKCGMDEQFFINNLIALSQLAEKRTYASEVFWNAVAGLFKEK